MSLFNGGGKEAKFLWRGGCAEYTQQPDRGGSATLSILDPRPHMIGGGGKHRGNHQMAGMSSRKVALRGFRGDLGVNRSSPQKGSLC